MSCEGLVDKRAYLVVLGCLMKNPVLLEDIDRPITKEDFISNNEKFYAFIYTAIFNLYVNGAQEITEFDIDSYLSNFAPQYKIFQMNRGLEYLSEALELGVESNYDYYYHRLRKYSLLRYYESKGLDTRFIYNSSLVDSSLLQAEQIKFDNYTEKEIVELVETDFVINPNVQYCTNTISTNIQAGEGMLDLIEELRSIPDIGIPLNNIAMNTVTRGARLGCLYMRSAPSGHGKSRLAAGDACTFAVPYVYDEDLGKFIYTGCSEPTTYFTTEMTCDEIQTLIMATVSKVNEEKIISGTCTDEEFERIKEADMYIKQAPLYIVHIPDFNIADIVNAIKLYHRQHGVNYFIFDYIHSSLRLMSEINGKSGGGLKEYQMLMVFATELKTIAQQLNVFILTASQLSAEASTATYKDANLLQGSKALANKLDVGFIAMPPSAAELKKVDSVIRNSIAMPAPNMCYYVYKLRRGRLTKIIVWNHVDLGTMTETPLFVTDYEYRVIDIEFTSIDTSDQQEAKIEETLKEHSIAITKVKNDEQVETTEDKTKSNLIW